jgi:hypothetical protein
MLDVLSAPINIPSFLLTFPKTKMQNLQKTSQKKLSIKLDATQKRLASRICANPLRETHNQPFHVGALSP